MCYALGSVCTGNHDGNLIWLIGVYAPIQCTMGSTTILLSEIHVLYAGVQVTSKKYSSKPIKWDLISKISTRPRGTDVPPLGQRVTDG